MSMSKEDKEKLGNVIDGILFWLVSNIGLFCIGVPLAVVFLIKEDSRVAEAFSTGLVENAVTIGLIGLVLLALGKIWKNQKRISDRLDEMDAARKNKE